MPRIPLYNRGLGPSVQMATGQLSRRADVSAFTAPGRALSQFGERAGNIAFQFGMQERAREDKTILAEEQLAAKDYFATKLMEDQSLSTQEAEQNFQRHRDEYIQRLDGKGYSERRKSLVLGEVNNIFAQRNFDAKLNAFNRATKRATETDNMFLQSSLETLRVFSPESPQYQKAQTDVASTFANAQAENRKLSYTPQSYELQVKLDRANLSFTSATTPAEADEAYNALKDDPTIPPAKLLQAKNLRNTTKARLGQELYDSTLETITELTPSADEAAQIASGYDAGEDFSITRESGEELSFSVQNMPIRLRRQIASVARTAAKEFNDGVRAGIIADMTNAFEEAGADGVMAIATTAMTDAANKEEADAAILGGARLFEAQSKIAYANGEFETATAFANLAESLVNESFMGRPSLSQNAGSVGTASNSILKSVAQTRVEIEGKRQEQAKISVGVSSLFNGTYDNLSGFYSKTEETQILNQAMSGQSLPQQMEILEQNNVTYQPFRGVVDGAATEGLGATPDINAVSQGLELYRQLKVRGKGVLNNHTDETSRAFFDSVLALESVGVETSDAITRVNRAFQTGVDVNAKYSTVKSAVDEILDNSVTTIFGITISGERVDNRVSIHQKVEDLSKIYIRMGTMSAEEAVSAAMTSIQDTHINLRGQLIPRRKNFPFYPKDDDLRRMVDLAAKNFTEKYGDDEVVLDEDDNVSLVPFPGRVDQWQILINGMPATTGIDSIYTLDDLQGLMAGDRKTQVDAIIQENLEKRGLTEEDKLIGEAQELRRRAGELTGANLAKIRREQGEAAAQAAAAERQRLLDEAESITQLLNESKRLQSGN